MHSCTSNKSSNPDNMKIATKYIFDLQTASYDLKWPQMTAWYLLKSSKIDRALVSIQ